jgi:hypothetical protein
VRNVVVSLATLATLLASEDVARRQHALVGGLNGETFDVHSLRLPPFLATYKRQME